MAIALEARNISKSFGGSHALRDVSCEFRTGSITAVLGANGAGKSTLMKILSGSVSPDGGTLLLFGETYSPSGPISAHRSGVAMVHQELSVAHHLSVMENLLLGVEPVSFGFVDRRSMRKRTFEVLSDLGHPEIDPETEMSLLSPAVQQLVEIGRAIAVGARVLILDEPTSSLGRADSIHLFSVLRKLRDEGISIIYISHLLDEILSITDEYVVLRDGSITGTGKTKETDINGLISLMVGETTKFQRSIPSSAPTNPILTFSAEPEAIPLHAGEILGIAGLLGSGRSFLLRSVFGLENSRHSQTPDGSPPNPNVAWKTGYGFVSEDRRHEGLSVSQGVRENVVMTDLDRFSRFGFISKREQHAIIRELVARLDIKSRGPDQRVDELSGGNQQKVALSRLLFHDSSILILDEPTRGIDIGSKQAIYSIIDRLVRGEKTSHRAAIVVSSDLSELLLLCDRIAVMHRGVLRAIRPGKGIDENSLLEEIASSYDA